MSFESLNPLPREFFDRPATEVAPDLLGCVLMHGPVGAELVEVEAYMGSADPPSHAFRGRTPRNAVMFGEPGHAYVYFTYGMHFCVNLVCLLPGTASAVLLRAGRIVAGLETAAQRRLGAVGEAGPAPGARPAPVPGSRAFEQLASGPARLCQALGIARDQNGLDVCDPGGALRICAPSGFMPLSGDSIAAGPRVGVSSGADVPWRYWIAGDKAVSAYRRHVPRKRQLNVTRGPRDGIMQR